MTEPTLPMDAEAIQAILPHRPPFLFVDRIVELDRGAGICVGEWTLAEDAWIVEGHFPGYPVMPGVIILESIAQVGAVGILTDPQHAGKIPLFAGANDVRFKRQIRPGETVRIETLITRMRGDVGWAHGRALVGDELACSADIIFAVRAVDR